jgi:cell wall-associated NlpC family hydrolase
LELNFNPIYLWGGTSLLPGAPGDCSGKIYAIFASCGVPVQRLTAKMMAAGFDGWNFPKVDYAHVRPLAVFYMTMVENRPQGHMAIIQKTTSPGVYIMLHMSSTAGFVAVTVKAGTWPYKHFDWARNVK